MLAHAEKYSFAFYKNGGAKSLELLEQGKIPEKDMWKYSSFWFKDFDGMALKTMLRQLISKWGIMSIDLQNAIDKDMAGDGVGCGMITKKRLPARLQRGT